MAFGAPPGASEIELPYRRELDLPQKNEVKMHPKRPKRSREKRIKNIVSPRARGPKKKGLRILERDYRAQGQNTDLYVAWPAAEAGPLEVFDFESDRHLHLLQAFVINQFNTLCSLLKQGAADI